MRRQTILAAVSLLALSIAAPAMAQQADVIAPGQTIQGEIAEGDATAASDAYRYDDYLVRARAGQRFEAIMRAGEFDAFLEVFRQGEADALVADDDGLGEGTDSRLRFTADRDGTYVLRARNLSGLQGGAYALDLTQRPSAGRAPRPGGIRIGQSIEGALTVREDRPMTPTASGPGPETRSSSIWCPTPSIPSSGSGVCGPARSKNWR